ncbi:hypothetical protein MRB53_039163 [Persea americana]|nr:hypothetical protein MRB53_039163 [Persea americana]
MNDYLIKRTLRTFVKLIGREAVRVVRYVDQPHPFSSDIANSFRRTSPCALRRGCRRATGPCKQSLASWTLKSTKDGKRSRTPSLSPLGRKSLPVSLLRLGSFGKQLLNLLRNVLLSKGSSYASNLKSWLEDTVLSPLSDPVVVAQKVQLLSELFNFVTAAPVQAPVLSAEESAARAAQARALFVQRECLQL